MAHSHGGSHGGHGGGHHGGGHHGGGHHGGSHYHSYYHSNSYLGSPFYGESEDDTNSLYTPSEPHKWTVGEIVAVALVLLLITLSVGIALLVNNVPIKLSEKDCVRSSGYFEDKAGVISSSTSLISSFDAFYNKTGIQPYLYVINAVDVPSAYISTSRMSGIYSSYDIDKYTKYTMSQKQIEHYAEDLYYKLFDDEGHWLLVFVIYPSNQGGFEWVDMAGDKTNHIINNKVFSNFQKSINSYSSFNAYAVANAMDKATKDAMSMTGRGAPIFFGVVFLILAVVTIVVTPFKIRKLVAVDGGLGKDEENSSPTITTPTTSTEYNSNVTITPTSVVVTPKGKIENPFEEPRKVRCHACGAEYDAKSEFCPYCGGDNLEIDGFKK